MGQLKFLGTRNEERRIDAPRTQEDQLENSVCNAVCKTGWQSNIKCYLEDQKTGNFGEP